MLPGPAGPADDRIHRVLTGVLAEERLRIVAGLIGRTHEWELAEDCLQDAVERALTNWTGDGLPDNPAAWLTIAAHRRAIDVLRRRSVERAKLSEVAIMDARSGTSSARPDGQPDEWPDDRLKLIFTCCHPALSLPARVALTLKTVAGLTTQDIANAFLTSEPTISQRLLRARAKISNAGIPYRVPDPGQLDSRVAGVLAVTYVIFAQGYRDPSAVEMSSEALRLAGLLADLLPEDGEVAGLQALLCFQHARRRARIDEDGELVTMEDQDRTLFDQPLIDRGVGALARARGAGRYRLQAEIAALHATAPAAEATDWPAILSRYDALVALDPSPVVALNRSVALAFTAGIPAALRELERLGGAPPLRRYHLLPATRADLLRRAGRTDEAITAYRLACELAPDGPERRFLLRRLTELGGRPPARSAEEIVP